MTVWFWLCCLAAAVFLYFWQVYNFFKRRGVKTLPVIPPFGTLASVFLKQEHLNDQVLRAYKKFSDQRFYGDFRIAKPIVMVKEIELIKKITVKDFEHFLDHTTFIREETDPIFGRNLFSLKGQEWKDMRSTLSPAFTSSKMKKMLPLMVEVGHQMIFALNEKIKNSQHGSLEVDAKDLMTRFANDVIASCAFGLNVNSHVDKDNKFYIMGKAATNFSFTTILKVFLGTSFPFLSKIFNISLFPDSLQNFFRMLVLETMQNRELKQIIRPDMIHLLMETKKGKLSYDEKSTHDAGFATVEESFVGQKAINRVWSDDDLCAQAVLFLLAGFDTVSTTMNFLLYELAINPDVQERLYQEIKENEVKNNGKFDYNSVQSMVYMDMVVSETLRFWSPIATLDKVCTKDYNLGKPNDQATEDYIVRKGDSLQIPVWPIHRDPKYYQNPDKFDPERFSEENKHKIQPFTYMPFAVGPRNCIGSRFALCEVKVMAYQLLKSFELSPSKRTVIPLKFDAKTFNLTVKGGNWIQFKPRKVK